MYRVDRHKAVKRLVALATFVAMCCFTATSQDVVDGVVTVSPLAEQTTYPYNSVPVGSTYILQQTTSSVAEGEAKQAIVSDYVIVRNCSGRDWRQLRVLASLDDNVPSQQAVVDLLDIIAAEAESGRSHRSNPILRLQNIDDGKAYDYLVRNHFPKLRVTKLLLANYRAVDYSAAETPSENKPQTIVQPQPESIAESTVPTKKPFCMAIKTNLLEDIALVPNIGIEFHLGRGFSVAASWHHAWWKNDSKKQYWRTYGGELAIRKYLGRAAKEKPLTGHHLGIYGQAFTYDFAFGSKGWLCDTWSYAAGIEYGYSVPIHRRLNLDFVIGIGYMQGLYKEYIPQDDCDVWQATKRLQWIGPTKAEISLVWLIGRGNYNNIGKNRKKK